MRTTIALAQLPFPESREQSVDAVVGAIQEAAERGASIVAFAECFVPGYRAPDRNIPAPDQAWLDTAWAQVARAAGEARIAVVLGTERVVPERTLPVPTALVVDASGNVAGFQDKVQIAPEEDALYAAGVGRNVFHTAAGLRFGVVICHEGWRYPETVREVVRRGAQVVFHPHFHDSGPADGFHQHAVRCRAAENTCYFATVNYAVKGSPTTSSIAAPPDGELIATLPAGHAGLLIAELNLSLATGLLASRLRT
jgi:predicted amidohydrolase